MTQSIRIMTRRGKGVGVIEKGKDGGGEMGKWNIGVVGEMGKGNME